MPSTACSRASSARRAALGAYLNELADVVSDAALYLPFAFVAPFGPWSVAARDRRCVRVSEMAGALGPMVGATRRYDGPMGKSDRALVFGALGLCVGLGGALPDVAVVADAGRSRCCSAATSSTACAAASPKRAEPRDERRFTPPVTRVDAARVARAHVRHARRRRRSSIAIGRRRRRESRGAIVMFHRGHEHSGRMAHLPDELDLPDFDFFAWDARGHGRSPGARGHAPSFGTSVRDVADVRRPHRRRAHGFAPEDDRRRRAERRRGAGRRPGRTTTRRASAAWCSRRRRSRSSSTCRSRCRACGSCTGCAAISSSTATSRRSS